MKLCDRHASMLESSIKANGLEKISPSRWGAICEAEVNGVILPQPFDPFRTAQAIIENKAREELGRIPELIPDSGMERCAVCTVLLADEDYWITGPVQAILREAMRLDLLEK